MKRILVVARRINLGDGSGGLERAAAVHIRLMMNAGWRVDVATSHVGGARADGKEQASEINGRLLLVPWPRGFSEGGGPTFGVGYTLWAKAVAKSAADEIANADIVHWHGSSAGALAGLSVAVQSKSVMNPHGLEEFGRDLLRLPSRLFLRRLTRRGACRSATVIATDTAMLTPVLKHLRIDPEAVALVPNVVDVGELSASTSTDVRRWDVVSVGRIVHNKGFDLLAGALCAIAAEDGRPFSWRHFGSGSTRSLDKVLRGQELVHYEVVRRAPDKEVYSTMRSAGAVVVPSRYEGSSLVVMEAMAVGAMVVACPVGGIPEKITDGVNGYLAGGVSVRALSRSIREAWNLPVHDRRTITGAAVATARLRFDLPVAAERYVRIYGDVLAKRDQS